jgi:4-amino-4-deoxy-L-arabinose transferase-like glycosyltransferase
VVAFLFSQKTLGIVKVRDICIGMLIFLIVVVPWYLAIYWREGAPYLYENIIRQNLIRFLDAWSHKRPVYYYFTTLPLDFFPWSLFLPMGFILAFRAWKENGHERFFLLWFVWMFVFLSLSSGKISKYMLPALPAACVIASLPLPASARRYNSVVFFLLAAVFFALAGVLLFYQRAEYPEFSVQRAVLAAVCVVLALSLAYLTSKRQLPKAFGALFSGLVIVFMIANTSVFATLNHYKSARPLCEKIQQHVADGTPWVYYGSMRGVYVYYVGKTAIAVDEHRTADLQGLAARQKRFYVLTRKRDVAEVQQALGRVEPVLEEKIGDTVMVFVRYAETAGRHDE